ncbi:MAG: NAD(+)/NADH kinase [Candidatus Bipolaricaulaceae bacterium]
MELRSVLFVYNADKPGAREVAGRGEAWCRGRGIAAQVTSRRRFSVDTVDMVVGVGGDGTLLRVASAVYPRPVPILGVHMGSLGFLAACRADAVETALERATAGQVRLEHRLRLAAQPGNTALNDVAVVGPGDSRFTEVALRADSELVAIWPGDGLVLATPTGATAYALAAGGPLVRPDTECLVAAPVNPHRIDIRPVVLPATARVEIRAGYPATLLVDGDPAGRLAAGAAVALQAAPAPTVLVRLSDELPFYARARAKLGWSRWGVADEEVDR